MSNRAINYVFSSNVEVGENWPSPYTKKSIDNVLSTTKENLNKWVTVKANVKEDFKKFHDLNVDELDGLAIMSDTDNSKLTSVAFYQNIYLHHRFLNLILVGQLVLFYFLLKLLLMYLLLLCLKPH